MPYRIHDIAETNSEAAVGLAVLRIRTTEDLLLACSKTESLRELSQDLGLSEEQMRRWVAKAKLLRIWGLVPRQAALLQVAGIDSLEALRACEPRDLTAILRKLNLAQRLVRRTPTESMVQGWIHQARNLASTAEN
jgi:predicted flap endonuclease-1-like 5' DNA nuclease